MAGTTIQGLPDPPGVSTTLEVIKSSNQALNVNMFNALVPVGGYDYISLSYTGANLTTVVYKSGGSGGTTIATLTLAYSGSDLTSVTRT